MPKLNRILDYRTSTDLVTRKNFKQLSQASSKLEKLENFKRININNYHTLTIFQGTILEDIHEKKIGNPEYVTVLCNKVYIMHIDNQSEIYFILKKT